MDSCTGTHRAAGPRPWVLWGPNTQYLEPASWCGVGWGQPAYPSSPHPGLSRDPPACPRSVTWICVAHTGPKRPCPAVRGLTHPVPESRASQDHGGLDPISLCFGPGWGSNHLSPHRARGQVSPGPFGLGAGVLCRVCRTPGGTEGGGRAQCVLCTTHLHPPFRGSLPSLLPASPGFSMGQSGF